MRFPGAAPPWGALDARPADCTSLRAKTSERRAEYTIQGCGRLETLLALVAQHKDALAPWGINDDDLQHGKTLLAGLGDANVAQEQALRNLPPKTRELYVIKGRAYLLLKGLSRAARRCFIDDPATAGKLDLHILNRKGRRAKEPAPAPTT